MVNWLGIISREGLNTSIDPTQWAINGANTNLFKLCLYADDDDGKDNHDYGDDYENDVPES